MKLKTLITILLLGLIQTSMALDSDSEQPATLDADDMEMDFASGVRTYRGNVVFSQGSIRMNCDELVTYLNNDGALDKAVCVGSPARFKQRPEGQDKDMKGAALEIIMDQIEELVTLNRNAVVEQGTSVITGKIITYNLATEKANVKGGGSQSSQSSSAQTTSESSSEGSDKDTTQTEGSEAEGNARPSLTIQPRKKEKASDEESASESETESE